jgi:hypothetical protein
VNSFKQFLQKWQGVLLIFALSISAYGLLISWLGFYVDDWTFNWIYQTFGLAGLVKYFSTNRPIWGVIYQMTMPLLQDNVLGWHLFGLFWRILTSLSFYWLMTLLWPKKKGLTLAAALLFAVYPGFLMQPLALTFGHIWLIYTVFLVSNCLTVLAMRTPARRMVYSIAAVLFSLVNILCMEYFLPLEVIRLVLLFYLVAEPLPFFKRWWKAICNWLPYMVALILVTLYRVFFFKDQTHIYSLRLFTAFKQNILAGTGQLFKEIGSALYQSAIFAWVQPFTSLFERFNLNRTFELLMAFIVVLFVALMIVLLRIRHEEENSVQFSPLLVALSALLFAGIPFYVTALPVEAKAFNSRFTLPFIFGASLLLAYMVTLIPVKWLRVLLLSLILAFSVGFNILNANDYRLMSQKNNELMYELAWRAPNLKPDTLVVTTEQTQSFFFTESTMQAELNLIYPHDKSIMYGWGFTRDLSDEVSTPMQKDTLLTLTTIVHDFNGNSNNVVVFQNSDDGCLRFIDSNSKFIPSEITDYSYQNISNATDLVSATGEPKLLNAKLIGQEPAHGWCYYFEKSDLALQLKDYTAIQKNYQIVIDRSLKPYYGYEWFPFIEGLAWVGNWQSALSLSQRVIEENPTNDSYQSFLCQMLSQAAEGTSPNTDSAPALSALNCSK